MHRSCSVHVRSCRHMLPLMTPGRLVPKPAQPSPAAPHPATPHPAPAHILHRLVHALEVVGKVGQGHVGRGLGDQQALLAPGHGPGGDVVAWAGGGGRGTGRASAAGLPVRCNRQPRRQRRREQRAAAALSAAAAGGSSGGSSSGAESSRSGAESSSGGGTVVSTRSSSAYRRARGRPRCPRCTSRGCRPRGPGGRRTWAAWG